MSEKCPYCDTKLRPDQERCPGCGARNESYRADSKPAENAEAGQRIVRPLTIEQLKQYCAERKMPLSRMRFYIDQDFQSPKAFGIFRDGKDFVVYKNKADGTRAVRYRGRDEARAVTELFDKLLDECHRRGIYPDGAPPVSRGGKGSGRASSLGSGCLSSLGHCALYALAAILVPLILRYILILLPIALGTGLVFFLLNRFVFSDKRLGRIPKWLGIAVSLALVIAIALGVRGFVHRNDGYYRSLDNSISYHYGSKSYYVGNLDPLYAEDSGLYAYGNGYLGDEWDYDWGYSGYDPPTLWDDLGDAALDLSSDRSDSDSDSDSDWDSWDSSDTDWDSDW